MKICVHVKANSRFESIEQTEKATFLIKVRTPPVDGKANERVREILAKHLGVAKSRIILLSGAKSKRKIFELS